MYRSRLQCKLIESKLIHLNEDIQNSSKENQFSLQENFFQKQENIFEIVGLNEVIVSRGPSSYLSNLDLYINDYLVTTVQGDGLIVSTPTGSTAYAMSAGASMSHPSVQSIIITPICPHSLSFRPIIVPAGVEVKIELSPESRHTAFYSVDGRNPNELKCGYYLSIKLSEYPMPTISRSDQIGDWFEGLATCLNWNQRQKQLPLNSCYLRSRSGSKSDTSPLISKSNSTSSLKQNLNLYNISYHNVNSLNVPSVDSGYCNQIYNESCD